MAQVAFFAAFFRGWFSRTQYSIATCEQYFTFFFLPRKPCTGPRYSLCFSFFRLQERCTVCSQSCPTYPLNCYRTFLFSERILRFFFVCVIPLKCTIPLNFLGLGNGLKSNSTPYRTRTILLYGGKIQQLK